MDAITLKKYPRTPHLEGSRLQPGDEDLSQIPFSCIRGKYLVVEENGKKIVLSGCSHKGILNIVVWLKPDVLVGGFHFMKLDPMMPAGRSALDNAAGALLSTGATFYTGHCTGEAPFAYLKYRMGSKLHGFSAGSVLEI